MFSKVTRLPEMIMRVPSGIDSNRSSSDGVDVAVGAF